MRIGIDLMGSDSSPLHLFQGVLQAAEEHNATLVIVVIATSSIIDTLELAAKKHPLQAQLEFYPADEVITMMDEPLSAVRRKKNSTLMVGIHLLKEGYLDALVSAGNTGALITGAKVVLPMFYGIRRPALLAQLPTKRGMLAIIDAGGNIKNTPTSLIQYAYMGIAYQSCCADIKSPTVGLLSVGVEPNKGTPLLRQTYALLKNLSETNKKFHFVGNIEARDLFEGKVDVLVTDGFTGNVLLKAIEGTATYLLHCFSSHLPKTSIGEHLQSNFNYAEYPGALVCGVDGILIKCHGNASKKSIYSAISGAIEIFDKQLIPQMRESLRPI